MDRLERSGIAADDERREVRDDAGEPGRRAVRVGHLRPADESVVGRRLDEKPGPPAGVAGECLERSELHGADDTDAPACTRAGAAPSESEGRVHRLADVRRFRNEARQRYFAFIGDRLLACMPLPRMVPQRDDATRVAEELSMRRQISGRGRPECIMHTSHDERLVAVVYCPGGRPIAAGRAGCGRQNIALKSRRRPCASDRDASQGYLRIAPRRRRRSHARLERRHGPREGRPASTRPARGERRRPTRRSWSSDGTLSGFPLNATERICPYRSRARGTSPRWVSGRRHRCQEAQTYAATGTKSTPAGLGGGTQQVHPRG